MKFLKDQVVATTNPNSAKRPVTEAELRRLYSQMPDPYIFNQAHDESLPPGGKAYNKKLKRLTDGNLAFTMDVDLYDDALTIPPGGFSISTTHKEMRGSSGRESAISVYYDEAILDDQFGRAVVSCSDQETAISALSRVDRDAGNIAIIVVGFVSVHVFKGFFQELGKEAFRNLRQVLIKSGSSAQQKTGGSLTFHFKVKYQRVAGDVEVLIRCSQNQLGKCAETPPDIESLFNYLDDVIGHSAVYRVVVEVTHESPFWRIVSFVDPDGKLINL